MESTLHILLTSVIFKLLAFLFDCTGQFVADLVTTPEDQFSGVMFHILIRSYSFRHKCQLQKE